MYIFDAVWKLGPPMPHREQKKFRRKNATRATGRSLLLRFWYFLTGTNYNQMNQTETCTPLDEDWCVRSRFLPENYQELAKDTGHCVACARILLKIYFVLC